MVGPPVPVGSVERAAVRFVRAWGFTTVGMVAEHFRLTTTTTAARLLATESRLLITRRALARLRDLRWLDPTQEWFTLIDRDSRPKAAFAKILAVTGEVDREDLALALGKRHSFRDVPKDVVRVYLAELLANHGRARAKPAPAVELTRVERILVEALEERGGRAEIEILRRAARPWSISASALKETLSGSPLFVRVEQGIYGLIGAPVRPRTLLPSGQWDRSAAAV
jgi:hypothetical protein